MIDTPDPDPALEVDIDSVLPPVRQDLPQDNGISGPTKRRYQPGEIETSRDRLFFSGSNFKPVERSEIVGINNVLERLDRVIHWLQNSAEYQKYNSRLEPGIILEGDPGTGKTLVSRYIATESRATFINVREFEHEGQVFKDSDISDLFGRAREKYQKTRKPIILFWDEFEGTAVNREEVLDPGQIATVSQISEELDGIYGKNEGILLIGCTNYIHGIDPALQRSGRMGLQIEFHPPDREGKRLLLDYYLDKYKINGNIDVETLAFFFDVNSTAAEIEEASVEAWRYAVERSIKTEVEPHLTQDDLIQVFIERLVGPPVSFVNLTGEDFHRVAVHEAGHAIMASVLDLRLRLVTVHPGKNSLGRVMYDEEREHISTHGELLARLRTLAGSMAAEREAGLEGITGSSQDISLMNELAVRLVDDLDGGSRLRLFHPLTVSATRSLHVPPSPSLSQDSIDAADMDVQGLLQEASGDAAIVMRNIGGDNIHAIAKVMCERDTMTGGEFQEELVKILGTDDFGHFLP